MLSFTALEIITRAQQRLRRTASDFLSPEEYRSLCDVAWRRCYNRMARKFPTYYSADGTINVSAGTISYPLPTSPPFRSMQLVMINDASIAGHRVLRPIPEVKLEPMRAPDTNAIVQIRYVPEPTRIPTTVAGDAVSLTMPVAADEWIVNAICWMVITKEGTDRQPYDMSFAMLDAELETYANDFDLGWPNEINEVWPGAGAYAVDVTYTGNMIAGYILRGQNIEFYALRAPGYT